MYIKVLLILCVILLNENIYLDVCILQQLMGLSSSRTAVANSSTLNICVIFTRIISSYFISAVIIITIIVSAFLLLLLFLLSVLLLFVWGLL